MKNIKDMSENIEMKTLLQRFCDERIETVLQACMKNNKEYIDTLKMIPIGHIRPFNNPV